jgi:hypothetical protein
MGAIARSAANLITTSGVVLKGAVNNDSFDNVTALPSSFGDGITLISSQTASNSASISFTTGLDSTYKAYKFVFVNIQAVSSGNYKLTFNMSTDAGSNYNVTKTTTFFTAVHDEADTDTNLTYDAGFDLAQSTAFQNITSGIGSASDENSSGSMVLFNPSSTTYVKHFIANTNNLRGDVVYTYNNYTAGYGNTTSAVNAVQFKMSTGNMNGKIYMYGIK